MMVVGSKERRDASSASYAGRANKGKHCARAGENDDASSKRDGAHGDGRRASLARKRPAPISGRREGLRVTRARRIGQDLRLRQFAVLILNSSTIAGLVCIESTGTVSNWQALYRGFW